MPTPRCHRISRSVDWTRNRYRQVATRLTHATINKALAHLEKLGIVGRRNERRQGRVFSYQRYVELLNSELESAVS